MGNKIQVLDQGYVEFIEAWGVGKAGGHENYPVADDDYEVGIIEAARQSTQGAFRGWKEDKKLLRTLYHHQQNQSTPFEMAGMTIEVQAPIFVFREWHRHRTQSYNEQSARYSPLPDLYYVPDIATTLARTIKTGRNKQAGKTTERVPTPVEVDDWIEGVKNLYDSLEHFYQLGLKIGIPKELARITMPVGHYTRMRASANLRNWLAFLTLRTNPNAQWEIRQFAEAVASIVGFAFPHTYDLFAAARDEPERLRKERDAAVDRASRYQFPDTTGS